MLKWSQLYDECINCNKCTLVKNRTNMVFGEGNISAPIMFIGEAQEQMRIEQEDLL